MLVATLILALMVLTACTQQGGAGDTGTDTGTGAGASNDAASGTATGGDNSGAAGTGESRAQDGPDLSAGKEDLVIPLSGVSAKATFYPVVVNGMQMEVLAVEAPDGTVRTAFNTCQVCYDSGRGYYAQEGDELVCQNCGNRFAMDRVEVEQGGCNPWPIFAEYKTVTDASITIPYELLESAQVIFTNWKAK